MKKLLFLLLFVFQAYISVAQDIEVYDAQHYYTSDITYSYSPQDGLSIKDVNDTYNKQITFKYSGSALNEYLNGYAYLVLSPSSSLSDMNNCYSCALGRFHVKDLVNNTTEFVSSINIQNKPFYQLRGFNELGTMVTDTKEITLPKNAVYYHYIVLNVYKDNQWQFYVIEEKNRTTINYLKQEEPTPPNPGSVVDLQMSSMRIFNSSYNAGTLANVEVKVKNIGDAAADNVYCYFYISNKSQYDGNYNKIACNNGPWKIGKLTAGQESTVSFDITLPQSASLNSYFPNNTALYLLGYAEYALNEENTQNNSYAVPITIFH